MSEFETRMPSKYSTVLCSRDMKLIHASSTEFESAEVVIAITHKNQPKDLERALISAFDQTLVKSHIARIVILDDSSIADWAFGVKALQHPSVTLLSAECGSPARARNLLLDWADTQAHLQWIARLDADDELHSKNSLEGLWNSVKGTKKKAVIGSNKLRRGGVILPDDNIAIPSVLQDHQRLAEFIEEFTSDTLQNELPSCNLMLRTNLGLRYPNIRSAEDHWLVNRVLMLHQSNVAVCPYPIYSIYSLDGEDTKVNKSNSSWQTQRDRLAYVAKKWSSLLESGCNILGMGMEGIVWLQHNRVVKEFYPWGITDSEVNRLKALLVGKKLPIPHVRWLKCGEMWRYETPYISSNHLGAKTHKKVIIKYLVRLYRSGVSTLNIKRENLLITPDEELQYIDVGNDIQPLTTSNFRDMCARLYSIGILGNKDEEFVRRKSWRRQGSAFKALLGFEQFYRDLLAALHPKCAEPAKTTNIAPFKNNSVTLMIKSCGQDAETLTDQVTHIITQLSYPVTFAKTILLIDPHKGSFLRQYADANLSSVLKQARHLVEERLLDKVLIAPNDSETIFATYEKWFSQRSCAETHTIDNAPVFPHIWGFDQVNTKFLLHCDLDVLVGRRNWQHDYITDMIDACKPKDVLSIGFNISKSNTDFNPYHGESGEFAPESRFGLLDLNRVRSQLPIHNPISKGRFSLTWHRALQTTMGTRGLRSLRGGDPSSYYVHPCNEYKQLPEITIARDLIAQGIEPAGQNEEFDWLPSLNWKYQPRNESVVFLLKGRYTEYSLLKRCLNSLQTQENQNFGIILIDDASGASHNWCYPLLLGDLKTKTTLIRHSIQAGRMPNFLLAINEVCQDPQTLIAILDQDDCLMRTTIVDVLLAAKYQGGDLIQMPMYRPNKPLSIYPPDYTNPREKGGANVWSHLRAFSKALFNKVPESYFRHREGDWFSSVTDYLTMLPMSELAKNPMYLDFGYAYWHLRRDYCPLEKKREAELIAELVSKPSLRPTDE